MQLKIKCKCLSFCQLHLLTENIGMLNESAKILPLIEKKTFFLRLLSVRFILKCNLFLRVFCPENCKAQPSYWSPVIGNKIYTDVSNTSFQSVSSELRAINHNQVNLCVSVCATNTQPTCWCVLLCAFKVYVLFQ